MKIFGKSSNIVAISVADFDINNANIDVDVDVDVDGTADVPKRKRPLIWRLPNCQTASKPSELLIEAH